MQGSNQNVSQRSARQNHAAESQQQKQVQKCTACLSRPLVNDFGLSPPLRIGRIEWEQLHLSVECLKVAVWLNHHGRETGTTEHVWIEHRLMGQAQILSLPPQISYYLFPEPQFVISKMGRGLMAPIYGFRIK